VPKCLILDGALARSTADIHDQLQSYMDLLALYLMSQQNLLCYTGAVALLKTNKLFSDYAILAVSFGLAPSGGIHMQFVKGKPPETQYATCPGARAKRREVALGRPGFEPGRIRACLSHLVTKIRKHREPKCKYKHRQGATKSL
jgi:hypothetical protein